MRLRFLAPSTLAVAGVLATPSLAHAEDPTPPAESRAYMYLSPGVISIPVGDDDFSDLVDVGYEWGVGGGLMLAPAGKLAVGVGLGIHHAPLNADEDVTGWCGSLVDCDASFHLVRILPEIRVGRGFKHLFPYGYVAPGLAILTGSFTASAAGFTTDADDTDVGFNLGIGAGIQAAVWQGLFVGAEFGANLGFMADADDDDINVGDADEGYGAHTLNLRVMLGWSF